MNKDDSSRPRDRMRREQVRRRSRAAGYKRIPRLPLLLLKPLARLLPQAEVLERAALAPDVARVGHPEAGDHGSGNHPYREDEEDPAEPGGVGVVDADAAELGVREENLGDDGAELAEGGAEAVASTTVFCGEDFGGDGEGGCVGTCGYAVSLISAR